MSEMIEERGYVAGMIKEYALRMTRLDYEVSGPRIFVKYRRHIFATTRDADFSNIGADDVEDVTFNYIPEKNIFATLDDYSAMIECLTPYCKILIRRDQGIVAQLDETAQLLGRNIQVVTRRVNRLSSAFRSAAAALVKPCPGYQDGFAVAVGRNIYEALVGMTVLEKSAEVSLKAELLGGGKPISRYAAMSERVGYILDYREMFSHDIYGRFTSEGKDRPAGSGQGGSGETGRSASDEKSSPGGRESGGRE